MAEVISITRCRYCAQPVKRLGWTVCALCQMFVGNDSLKGPPGGAA